MAQKIAIFDEVEQKALQPPYALGFLISSDIERCQLANLAVHRMLA